MKVLITGAAGFIGNHLVGKLRDKHELFALSQRQSLEQSADRTIWIEQNLNNPLDYSRLPTSVDAVIHLAQSKFYKEFPEQAKDIFSINVNSTFNLLEYARRAGVKQFIFASTGGIYGYSYEKFVETDSVNPINFYLSSKYIAEILVANYQQFFDAIVFRLFFVYGAGQKPTMLIPRLVSSVMSGMPVTLQGSKGILINPIHVSDVVDAINHALELEGTHLINLGGPQVLSLREIGDIIGKQVGRAPLFTVESDSEPHHLIGDISKMKELLGAPSVPFSDGIVEVCNEMKRAASKPNEG